MNEDYKAENEILKQRINELEERLKKYTCGKNHKKYYENNKEIVMKKGAKYLQKLKEDNPEKLKEYRRKGCINRDKNGCKNIQKIFKSYMATGERPEKYRREYSLIK